MGFGLRCLEDNRGSITGTISPYENGEPSILAVTYCPHLRPRQPVLLGELPLTLAAAVLTSDVVVAAGIAAELGVVVADDIGDGPGVAAEAFGYLGKVKALGDQVGDLLVERVIWHGEIVAEGAREGKEREMPVCPMFSTETNDKECREDCAWYQKSAAAKGGQCAVLSVSTWLRESANKPAAKPQHATSRPGMR